LAQRHDIAVGDEIEVMGLDFQVVGLSDGTASIISNYVFVLKSTIESLLFSPEITSSIFVTLSDGVTLEVLRDRLSNLPGVDALSKNDVIANNERLFDRLFGAPIRLMVGIAFLVGTLVVGLVIYTASIERQREYGVLKAIGARNQMLYSVVIMQSLFATIAGAVIGIPLTWAAAQLIMALRPEFLVTLRPTTVLLTLLASLIMALLAAFFPTRMMAGLAPAEVFRR
jgi:putative ABC transport system permease protein